MPPGIPVATVAINGAKNAGILAAEIIGCFDEDVYSKVDQYKKDLERMVLDKAESLEELKYEAYLDKMSK
jgi:5-(carboxyamino)imidazole ribonucleotide mutase